MKLHLPPPEMRPLRESYTQVGVGAGPLRERRLHREVEGSARRTDRHPFSSAGHAPPVLNDVAINVVIAAVQGALGVNPAAVVRNYLPSKLASYLGFMAEVPYLPVHIERFLNRSVEDLEP